MTNSPVAAPSPASAKPAPETLARIQEGFEPVPDLAGFAAEKAIQYLFRHWAAAMDDGHPASILAADVDATIRRLQEFKAQALRLVEEANQPQPDLSTILSALQSVPRGDEVPNFAERVKLPKKRRTPAQVKALNRYKLMMQMEDNYMGSVFVTPAGAYRHGMETLRAHNACVALGMGPEHGLY